MPPTEMTSVPARQVFIGCQVYWILVICGGALFPRATVTRRLDRMTRPGAAALAPEDVDALTEAMREQLLISALMVTAVNAAIIALLSSTRVRAEFTPFD